MKFSHSLQFNAVPEWSTKYINYSHLKKIIYALQREKLYSKNDLLISPPLNGNTNNLNDENTPLLSDDINKDNDPYIDRFIKELDHELHKIDKFFISQETGLLANYNELKDDVHEFEHNLINKRLPSFADNGIASILFPKRLNNLGNPKLKRRNSTLSSTGLMIHRHSNNNNINNNKNNDDDDIDSINSNPSMSISLTNGSRDVESLPANYNINPIQAQQTRNTWGSIFNPMGQYEDNLDEINNDDDINFNVTPIRQYKLSLRKRIISSFTQLSELKDFIELNKTGFSKICKKFDKSLNTSIKDKYLHSITQRSHVFNENTLQDIKESINETIVTYAKLISDSFPNVSTTSVNNNSDLESNTNDLDVDAENNSINQNKLINFEEAEKELSSHLRDHIAWERNTVWKDMMNLERKAQSAKREDLMESTTNAIGKPLEKVTHIDTMFDGIIMILKSPSVIKFLSITLIFVLLLKKLIIFTDPLEQNCFAILIYASFLWATETLPLFVTSLLIPFLIVIVPVLKDPSTTQPLNPVESSRYILSTMWSSVIMLLLGGFTLAAALSKYNIAKVLSTYILASAGTNPSFILLTNMFVALFVSMWVSNVASPVLCYSIIQPLLRTLPTHSAYSKGLILGIALASNVGGMASPIASPQNIFAFGMMKPTPSWGEWFIVSIPVCIISILLIWILLIITFPPTANDKILQLHPSKDPFTATQWFVTMTCAGTIILWCLSNQLSGILGEMGIISIIPMLLLFGTGLLSGEDFNNFMWTIVILAMGGATLGKAVGNCGLLATIAEHIKEMIAGKSLFTISVYFGAGIITMATFVSHTVAAMILIPLMGEIGEHLPENHSRLLIMLTSLLSSCAMGLPTSGFPNVTAISMTDEVGDRYLNVGNFISRGVPSSLFCYVVVITVGYSLMRMILF